MVWNQAQLCSWLTLQPAAVEDFWPLREFLSDLDLHQSHHYVGRSHRHYDIMPPHFFFLLLCFYFISFLTHFSFGRSPRPPPLRCRHLQPVNSGVSYVGRSSLETTASLFLCIATTTRWPHCTASPAPAPPHPGPEVMGSRCGAREAGKCTHTHTHA